MIPARANVIIPPFYYRAPVQGEAEWDRISLDLTEQLIQHSTTQEVAAIIIEPMAVAGGMIVPSKNWMRGLRAIADRWNAILIFDEAQLAPGRTGTMRGFENYDVVPDIVTFAKGMTAGMPVCGAITTSKIAEEARGRLGVPWSGTYPQDPLHCAVALKQLQIVIRDRLPDRAATLGKVMERRLQRMQGKHEVIGDVRGKGMYRLLDIVTDPQSRTADPEMAERIRYFAALEGVLSNAVKNFIRLCPPLIISESELDVALGRLEVAIGRARTNKTISFDLSRSSSLATNEVL
jgi:4-aminobutyrate aminotransferase-like enzyme